MYVFAAASCAVSWRGSTVRLVAGEVWEASDPFVKERDDLFRSTPPLVRNTAGKPIHRPSRSVEQATRSPGEKRRGPVR